MREIKFRAWDKESKRIFVIGEIDFSLSYKNTFWFFPRGPWRDDKDIILMQYTGLKDKNGKEIYEGDIVKSPNFSNHMEVKYEEIELSDDMTAPGIGFQFNTFPTDMEVIGNIHENPELITK